MSANRRRYSPEFKRQAVAYVHLTGKPVIEVAWDLSIHASSLAAWVRQDRLDNGEEPSSIELEDGDLVLVGADD